MFAVFLATLIGQSIVGLGDCNNKQEEPGRPPIGYLEYLGNGHFIEAVFENSTLALRLLFVLS